MRKIKGYVNVYKSAVKATLFVGWSYKDEETALIYRRNNPNECLATIDLSKIPASAIIKPKVRK